MKRFYITFVTYQIFLRHTGMAEFDDIYFIRRIKDGHTDAFVHIVRRYERMVFTIVNKIVSRRVEAEDIVQEIFIKVFQSLKQFREESNFATWLYRIAYNTTISELRKRKHEFTAIAIISQISLMTKYQKHWMRLQLRISCSFWIQY